MMDAVVRAGLCGFASFCLVPTLSCDDGYQQNRQHCASVSCETARRLRTVAVFLLLVSAGFYRLHVFRVHVRKKSARKGEADKIETAGLVPGMGINPGSRKRHDELVLCSHSMQIPTADKAPHSELITPELTKLISPTGTPRQQGSPAVTSRDQRTMC